MSVVVKSPEDLNSALGAMGAEIKHLKEAGDRTESEVRSTVARMSEDVTARLAANKREAVEAAIEAAKQVRHGDGVSKYLTDASAWDPRQIVTVDSAKRGAKIDADSVVFGAEGVGTIQLRGYDDGVTWTPGYLDDKPQTEAQAKLQQLVEIRSVARAFGVRRTAKLDAAIRRTAGLSGIPVLKVWADNAGEAASLIPDQTMPMLERSASLSRQVAGLFQELPVTGGNSPIPFATRGVQPFIAGVPAAGDMNPARLTGSVPSITSVTGEPVTWAVSVPVHRDTEEDAIITWMPVLEAMMAEAIVDGREDAIVNGDTNGGDTALATWNPRSRWETVGQSNDHRLSWIGLRHIAIDESKSFDAASLKTPAQMLAQLARLDAGMSTSDVAWIVSPEQYLLNMITDSNVLTMDKMGANATLLTGQVSVLGGFPVILSEFVTADLNASGVFDDSTKTKTGYVLVNRSRFRRAVRRGPRFEIAPRAEYNVNYFVLTVRERFRRIDPTGKASVAYGYNIANS